MYKWLIELQFFDKTVVLVVDLFVVGKNHMRLPIPFHDT